MPGKATLQALVHGHVQGVFFRAFVVEKARELGVAGSVKNRGDGTVEVIAEGEKEILLKLIEYLKIGPPAASVSNVDIHWGDFRGNFNKFSIIYE